MLSFDEKPKYSDNPDIAADVLDVQHLFDQLHTYQKNDVKWIDGKSMLHVYHVGSDIDAISAKAYAMYVHTNPLAPQAFPSTAALESDLIDSSLRLFSGSHDATGIVTSGGTESIILAVLAMREWARSVGRLTADASILVPSSAHPAYEKAGHLLSVRVIRIQTDDHFALDVSSLLSAINSNVIGLVGSFPSLCFGTVDPIVDLGLIAEQFDLWLHVDACLGGFIAPFLREMGLSIPEFDFSISGVRSISADFHKFGYAPKGVGGLFFRSLRDKELCEFVFQSWPKGIYRTSGLYGTRSGGLLAAAWVVQKYLGESGYIAHATEIVRAKQTIISGLAEIGEFEFFGTQPLSVLSYRHKVVDARHISQLMTKKGWYTSLIADPLGFQQTITPVHKTSAELYIRDLKMSVESNLKDYAHGCAFPEDCLDAVTTY